MFDLNICILRLLADHATDEWPPLWQADSAWRCRSQLHLPKHSQQRARPAAPSPRGVPGECQGERHTWVPARLPAAPQLHCDVCESRGHMHCKCLCWLTVMGWLGTCWEISVCSLSKYLEKRENRAVKCNKFALHFLSWTGVWKAEGPHADPNSQHRTGESRWSAHLLLCAY